MGEILSLVLIGGGEEPKGPRSMSQNGSYVNEQ